MARDEDGFYVVVTEIGAVGIAWSAVGVTQVEIGTTRRANGVAPAWVKAVAARIRAHFAGRVQAFGDVPLDWGDVTAFRRRVYEAARAIPSRITDILWAGGVTNPVTYIEQLSYLIFLKLLDEEESDRELRACLMDGGNANGNGKLLFPRQSARYRWSKWKFKSGNDLRDFVRDEVFPYMASLVKDEPRVADAVVEEDPAQLIREVLAIEAEIQSGLEKLLKEIEA